MDAILALIMSKMSKYPALVALTFVIMIIVGLGSALFFKNNKAAQTIEAVAEEVIKVETGINVDFGRIADEVSSH